LGFIGIIANVAFLVGDGSCDCKVGLGGVAGFLLKDCGLDDRGLKDIDKMG
jgi:hypothetical protein